MKKPSGKTYECHTNPNLVRVDPYQARQGFALVFLDVELDLYNDTIELTPENARSLARDLKRAAKIIEKG